MAMYGNVWQCVAVCCIFWQCVAVYCSVLQCAVAGCYARCVSFAFFCIRLSFHYIGLFPFRIFCLSIALFYETVLFHTGRSLL